MKSSNREFDGGSIGLFVFVLTAVWLLLFHSNVFR